MVRLVQRLSLRWQPRIAAGRQLSSRPAHWDKDPDHLDLAAKGRHEALGWIKEVLGKPVHRSQEEQGKRHFWLDREMRAQGHSAGPDDSLLTLLRSVLARKGPLKATAWFLLYCSSVTAAFENARYASFTDETMMSEVFDEVTGVVQYVMTSQNVLQGCTGFLATALFMTLSFRINRAASRWWHGREVWARLLGQCRALSQTTQLSITDKAMASELSMLGYAFVRAAEFHVRAEPDERFTEAFGALLPPEELQGLLRAPHRPFFLSERLSARLADAYDLGFAKNVRLVVAIQRHITNLVQAMEDVESVRSTPEPWSYQKHNVLLMQLWLGLLPMALVPTLHYATPVLGGAIGYAVYKLEDVSVEICNPMGVDTSDIAMCVMNDRLQQELLAALLTNAERPPALKDEGE